MTWTEFGLIATTLVAIATAAAAIIRDRRKPQLDLASSDLVRRQVKKISDETNARRDLRVLQLENWAFDQVRPWGRDAVAKFDQQGEQVQELASALGRTVERVHLEPFPEMPPPLIPTD